MMYLRAEFIGGELHVRQEMKRIATIGILILAPTLVCAMPKTNKQKESIVVEVASTKTNVYTTYTRSTSWVKSKLPKDSYTYTDIIFAVVNGKHVVYTCAEHKNACPLLETGSKLPAEQDGDSMYLSPNASPDKKATPTHYRLASGSW
jgi:hypothetical protein